jgi:hypothetical protein
MKHPLAQCQIAAYPTLAAHYHQSNKPQVVAELLQAQQTSLWPMWPLCHLCHPNNNVILTLLQRNQYSLPTTNNKNQTTGATISVQLPTTPSSPHSGQKPRQGASLMYPNTTYFVVIGGTPIRIHNAHTLWCSIEGQNNLMCFC